jgi:hypothetical protein
MKTWIAPVAALALLAACSADPEPVEPAAAPSEAIAPSEAAAEVASADPAGDPSGGLDADADPTGDASSVEQLAIDRTRDAAKRLGGSLKERLVAEMGQGGPVAAAEVCSTEAAGMTASVVAESGITVGRSSLRLRNPDNAAPDWVAAWLTEQGERPVEGVAGFARVDEVEGVGYARFLAPLGVEAPCLVCHGPAEGLSPDVAGLLAERYPKDAAVGYEIGALRGVLWAESRVADAAPTATP